MKSYQIKVGSNSIWRGKWDPEMPEESYGKQKQRLEGFCWQQRKAKGWEPPSQASKRPERSLLGLRSSIALQTPWFWTSVLQKWQRTNFCCFKSFGGTSWCNSSRQKWTKQSRVGKKIVLYTYPYECETVHETHRHPGVDPHLHPPFSRTTWLNVVFLSWAK